MDGTRVTPTRYTGRLGIPLFSELLKIAILRLPTAGIPVGSGDDCLTTAEDGEACHRRLSGDRYACVGGDPGLRSEKLKGLSLWPSLRAFNSVLTASCVLDELEVGVACMGIIEYAFSSISARIGKAVVERGWVAADCLVHYKLHAEIDERHAEEFFAVIESLWNDERRRYFIEQGLELGAYIFDRLYRDMHAAGQKASAGSAT